MAVRMLVLYDLLPGVSPDEFAKWSREVDQPACLAIPVCQGMEVSIVARQHGFGPRYQVVEDIRAESAETWASATAAHAHAHVMEQWSRYGNPSSVLTMFCEPTAE